MSLRRLTLAVIAPWMLLVPAALTQVEPIADLPLTLGGQVSLGYTRNSGFGTNDNLYVSTSADLAGFYHDPRFLKFDIAPNYRWDRNGGDVLLSTGENYEGVSSRVDFLSGSSAPFNFHYNFFRNNRATLVGGSVPISLSASGLNHDFGVGWTLRNKVLPQVSVNYTWGSSHSSVTGVEAPEITNDRSGVSIFSTYTVLGTHLHGAFTRHRTEQQTPDLLQLGQPQGTGKTVQTGYEAGFNRTLPAKSTLDVRFNRNHADYDIFGTPQEQRYDTANATLSSSPTKRLNLSLVGNYVSNAAAQAIADLIVPTPSTATQPLGIIEASGRALGYGASASLDLGRGFYLQSSGLHQSSSLAGNQKIAADAFTAGLFYTRMLKGGLFNASYSPGLDRIEYSIAGVGNTVRAFGQTGTVAYMRRVGRWTNQGSFRYSQTDVGQSAFPLPIITRTIAGDFRTTTRLRYRWQLTLNVLLNHNAVPNQNGTFNKTFGGSLANRTWTFTVQEQLSNGYAVATTSGLSNVNVGDVFSGVFPRAFYTDSSGLSVSATYARRQLSVTAVYSNTDVQLTTFRPTKTGNGNFDSRVVYKLRKIEVRGGFRWWSQMTTANTALDLNQRMFWVEVVRPFRLF